jgi:ParB-like chromosome segregation protein Spo0J
LQLPIEICDGKIIDGRRRWMACQKIGVKAMTKDVSPADPIAYVLSLNFYRRHLTASQAAMVGARAREIYNRQAKDRQKASGGDKKSLSAESVVEKSPPPISDSGNKARAAVGVSGKMILPVR